MRTYGGALLSTVAAFALAAASSAAASPQRACQAAKNKTAGAYAACRQSAEAKLATKGDSVKYAEDLGKCGTKFAKPWQKAINKAAKKRVPCPDAPLAAGDFATVIDAHTDNVKTALTSGGLDVTPPGQPLKSGQTTGWDELGSPIPCVGTGQDGELQKGFRRAYVDNADGTVTDTRTGLMREKLWDDGSIYDMDDTYTWKDAFAVKVAGLNTGGGFAKRKGLGGSAY